MFKAENEEYNALQALHKPQTSSNPWINSSKYQGPQAASNSASHKSRSPCTSPASPLHPLQPSHEAQKLLFKCVNPSSLGVLSAYLGTLILKIMGALCLSRHLNPEDSGALCLSRHLNPEDIWCSFFSFSAP